MKQIKRLLSVIYLVVLLVVHQKGMAQSGGITGASFRMGIDPIGISMGNSISAWSSNESSALYNPALVTSIQEGVSIQPATSRMSFDRSLHSLEARFPLPPTAALSLSVTHFRITGIDGRTQSGYPTGEISTSDFRLAGIFGISLSDQLKAGIGIKWNRSNYHAEVPVSSSVGLDFGVLYTLMPKLSLALVAQDLFSSFTWDTGQLYGSEQGQSQKQKFARRLKLAGHLQLSDEIDITSEIEHRSQTFSKQTPTLTSSFGDPDLRFLSLDLKENALLFRQGISWKYTPLLTFRSGIETSDLRLEPELFWGAGFSLYPTGLTFSPGIHYAYRNEPGKRSSVHSISFTFSF